MFLSLGIQRLATDYQGRIQLFSTILPLPKLSLLCIYPCFKNFSKASSEKRAHSAVLPVRRDITMGDKIEQGYLSMGMKLQFSRLDEEMLNEMQDSQLITIYATC